MNYEKEYKKRLDDARYWHDVSEGDTPAVLEEIFPELRESEDELTWLTNYIKEEAYSLSMDIRDNEDRMQLKNLQRSLAWLEKQSGQSQQGKSALEAIKEEKDDNRNYIKPVDKIEPKFHEGDWVVTSYGKVNQVIGVDEDIDGFTLDDGTYFSGSWKDDYHLWSIKDANPGDVLAFSYASQNYFLVYKGLYEKKFETLMSVFCFYNVEEDTYYDETDNFHVMNTGEIITPATKEQRDLLFQKMHEAGYTFDFEKKELKKLKFRVGDEVITENEESLTITRIDEEGYWSNDLFICDFDSECVWDLVEKKPTEWSLPYGKNETAEKLIALAEILEMDGDCLFNGVSGNSYGKFLRVLAKELTEVKQSQPKQEWKQENREELTEFENAMMHIGGSFFGENAGLDPNDTDVIKEQAELLLELAPKTEWGEEDEKTLNEIFSVAARASLRKSTLFGKSYDYIKWQNWLKSLRDRVQLQPKQEWSEEDENMVRYIGNAITCKESAKYLEEKGVDMIKAHRWLESSRHQKQWKPNEKQIKALRWVLQNIPYCTHKEEIYELLEQLKKLKGE